MKEIILNEGEEKFLYKSYCELQITSENLSLSFLENDLEITPSRFFYKGDKIISKKSDSIAYRHNSLWAFKTEQTESYSESITHHVKKLEEVFLNKYGILKKYKTIQDMNICIWIWIETDNAGIGFDLEANDLSFLSKIANNIHLSLICKNNF